MSIKFCFILNFKTRYYGRPVSELKTPRKYNVFIISLVDTWNISTNATIGFGV